MSNTDKPGQLLPTKSGDNADAAGSVTPRSVLTRRDILQTINVGLLTAGLGSGALMGTATVRAEADPTTPVPMGPHKVRVIETLWVPMSDGTKLAVRGWIPEDAEQHPVPALVEYIPYRRRDGTRLMDETRHPYWASYGYACFRPDIRGSGDSEGSSQDEYVRQEQDDGVELIAWLAKQPWCSGKVGMFGISWGGFSSLQVAARHPPELAAIITHCSTDDRYTDDAHYIGGCIVSDMFGWGSWFTAQGPRPPDPEIVGSRWRDMWKSRCESLDFYVGNWVSHQHRDRFWIHGSVDEDYSQITCPVYAVGGWADAYNCAIPRLLAGLQGPRKGLIGPWGHDYPNDGNPGPAIDWMTEALRWWDYWLKGIDTGIMAEPMYRVWMQYKTAMGGGEAHPQVSGRWVAEEKWPSARIHGTKYYLNASGLETRPGAESATTLAPLQTVGITAPHWAAFNMPTELPTDQRIDDARSLTFDSAPLEQAIETLGAPVAWLDLSVNRPVAFLAVRLNEVSPDGASRRVTYGVLNLCHRTGHESPQPLEPGRRYKIRLQLRDLAYRFERGNRLRLSVSTTYWPVIWPSPEAVTLTLYRGASSIELPIRPQLPQDAELRPFGPAFVPNPSSSTELEKGGDQTTVYDWDVGRRTLTIRSDRPYSRRRIDATGTETFGSWREVSVISDDDPTSARLDWEHVSGFYRPGWEIRVESKLAFRLSKDQFFLTGEIKAFDAGDLFFSRRWERPIMRSLV